MTVVPKPKRKGRAFSDEQRRWHGARMGQVAKGRRERHEERKKPDPEVRATAIREWILEMHHAARVEAGK